MCLTPVPCKLATLLRHYTVSIVHTVWTQLSAVTATHNELPGILLASFPGCSHLQNLITCSMQIRRGKAWEIWSRAFTSGRHTGGSTRWRISKPFLVLSVQGLEAKTLSRQHQYHCHSQHHRLFNTRCCGTPPPVCLSSVYRTSLHMTKSSRHSPLFSHTASDQILEVGMAWEWG